MPLILEFTKPVTISMRCCRPCASAMAMWNRPRRIGAGVKKLFGYKDVDGPELDELRVFVERELARLGATDIRTESE
jgi:hypothetical protein